MGEAEGGKWMEGEEGRGDTNTMEGGIRGMVGGTREMGAEEIGIRGTVRGGIGRCRSRARRGL